MPERLPEEVGIITPAPYLEVNFKCSNRAFYGVKDEVWNALLAAGIEEPNDGYFSEKCDYEGDLEKMIFYNGGREKVAAQAIIDYYNLEVDDNIATIHLVCL